MIAHAMSMQNSLRSLERRLRVLDELQVGRDACYERYSVIIFAMKCFSVGENVMLALLFLELVRHSGCTDYTRHIPHLNIDVPAPWKRCWGKAAGGTVLISSKMEPVSTTTMIPRCLPKVEATSCARPPSSIG